MEKMKANVFHGKNNIRVEEVERPRAGVGDAVIRVTLTTICGTDLHIVRGEYPVKPGLIIGHEPVGIIEELGTGVTGYAVGDRVLVGAITPCGQCRACLSGQLSQCGHGGGYEAIGGWRFGNTINGAQAEYLLVPNAQANLAKIPDELSDEQVVLLADIASTGFGGAESGNIRIGDSVVVFAQGPIGLCATAGAKLMGATLIIGVDGDDNRLMMAKKMGAGRYSRPPSSWMWSPEVQRCDGAEGLMISIDRGARHPADVRECPGQLASGRNPFESRRFTPASYKYHTKHSPPASATTASLRPSAPAARNACAADGSSEKRSRRFHAVADAHLPAGKDCRCLTAVW